ncbi:hypothetical protein D5086_017403 [Populus alba]|uniref:Uncharacterized protein n=1 Tax=Populus alba TaxID=43335 RepID=A0ACC4BYG2_POPAL
MMMVKTCLPPPPLLSPPAGLVPPSTSEGHPPSTMDVGGGASPTNVVAGWITMEPRRKSNKHIHGNPKGKEVIAVEVVSDVNPCTELTPSISADVVGTLGAWALAGANVDSGTTNCLAPLNLSEAKTSCWSWIMQARGCSTLVYGPCVHCDVLDMFFLDVGALFSVVYGLFLVLLLITPFPRAVYELLFMVVFCSAFPFWWGYVSVLLLLWEPVHQVFWLLDRSTILALQAFLAIPPCSSSSVLQPAPPPSACALCPAILPPIPKVAPVLNTLETVTIEDSSADEGLDEALLEEEQLDFSFTNDDGCPPFTVDVRGVASPTNVVAGFFAPKPLLMQLRPLWSRLQLCTLGKGVFGSLGPHILPTPTGVQEQTSSPLDTDPTKTVIQDNELAPCVASKGWIAVEPRRKSNKHIHGNPKVKEVIAAKVVSDVNPCVDSGTTNCLAPLNLGEGSPNDGPSLEELAYGCSTLVYGPCVHCAVLDMLFLAVGALSPMFSVYGLFLVNCYFVDAWLMHIVGVWRCCSSLIGNLGAGSHMVVVNGRLHWYPCMLVGVFTCNYNPISLLPLLPGSSAGLEIGFSTVCTSVLEPMPEVTPGPASLDDVTVDDCSEDDALVGNLLDEEQLDFSFIDDDCEDLLPSPSLFPPPAGLVSTPISSGCPPSTTAVAGFSSSPPSGCNPWRKSNKHINNSLKGKEVSAVVTMSVVSPRSDVPFDYAGVVNSLDAGAVVDAGVDLRATSSMAPPTLGEDTLATTPSDVPLWAFGLCMASTCCYCYATIGFCLHGVAMSFAAGLLRLQAIISNVNPCASYSDPSPLSLSKLSPSYPDVLPTITEISSSPKLVDTVTVDYCSEDEALS